MLKIVLADGQQPLDFDKYFILEDVGGEDQLGFTLPLDHPAYKLLAEEVQLLDAEDGQLYRITAIDEGEITANIKGKLELAELRASMMIPYTNGSATLAATITAVLPAGWSVVDHTGLTISRTVALDSATPEDVINRAAIVYGQAGDLAIRYKIKDRQVHLYDPAAFAPAGAYLSDELNLASNNFKGSSADLITRLYVRGKDGLTFSAINNGKDYVENYSYTDKVICGYWEDERYTVAENLLADAQKKVAASAVPVRSYSCSIKDLARAKQYEDGANANIYAHLDFQLLTVATLLDSRRGTRIDHQVVQLKRYPHYPDENVITLSTKAPTLQNKVKNLQDAIANPDSSFRQQQQAAIDNATNQITGNKGGYVLLHSSTGGKEPDEILIMDTPDIATARKIWRWNKSGWGYSSTGYNGSYGLAATQDGAIVADRITTGTLNATLAKIININASNINTGALNASLMTTGTLNAALAKIINIDASNINTGTINADLIKAGTIQSVNGVTNIDLGTGTIGCGGTSFKYISTPNGISFYVDGSEMGKITTANTQYGNQAVAIFGNLKIRLPNGTEQDIAAIGYDGALGYVASLSASMLSVNAPGSNGGIFAYTSNGQRIGEFDQLFVGGKEIK